MRKAIVAVPIVLLLIAFSVMPALAGFTWCMDDPNIKLPGNGGVVHVGVGVPDGFQDTEVVLDVYAPEGSRIVGKGGPLNLTVVLHKAADGEVRVDVSTVCPVLLSAKYRGEGLGEDLGEDLGSVEIEDGVGSHTWSY